MSDESRRKHSPTNGKDRSFQSVCELVERIFGHLLESMPDGIIITDTSGQVVAVNSEAEKLFGYWHGDLVSRAIETLVPDRLRGGHVSQRNSYVANPRTRPMGQGGRLFGHRRDGSEFPVEISLSPMKTDAGLLICAAVGDMPQRIKVEDALLASEEQVRLILDGPDTRCGNLFRHGLAHSS